MRAHRIVPLYCRVAHRRRCDVRPGRTRLVGLAHALRRCPAHVLAAERSEHLRRVDIEARVRVAVDVETRQPAPRAPRPHAGRDGQRRHALRAGVTCRRQLEQAAHARQRHRVRHLVAHVRGYAARPDGRLQRRRYGGANAHSEWGGPADADRGLAAAPREGISRVIAACSASPARAFPSSLAAAGQLAARRLLLPARAERPAPVRRDAARAWGFRAHRMSAAEASAE